MRVFWSQWFFVFFTCICTNICADAYAVPPGDDWFTLSTEHFRVHHTQMQREYATAFAQGLERALPKLSADLGWTPKFPIDIVINDESDSPNGFATSIPANKIEAYGVPFPTESSLLDYHDWVEELSTHELTHIIANDSGFGAYKTLRKIFGSIVKPNGLQPMWLIEGLAVYEETALTAGGRGRSLLTDAVLRTAVSHGLLNSPHYINLERFNNGVYWWPAGNTPYLMGYTILASSEGLGHSHEPSLEVEGAASIPGLLSSNNAGTIPYRTNGNVEDILGQEWSVVWQDTVERLKERYKDIGKDEDNPLLCKLTNGGRFTGGQALSPDGWLYFTLDHKDEGSALARIRADATCNEAKPEVLAERKYGGPSQVTVSPDGRYVAYSELALVDSFRQLYDLRLYDTKRRKVKDISTGLRAFDPSFAESGHELVFLRNLGNGHQALSKIQLVGQANLQDLYVAEIFERMAHPFIKGQWIYFSKHNNRGQEELFRMPLAGGTPNVLIDRKHFAKGEHFTESSAFIDNAGNLFFSAAYDSPNNSHSLDVYKLSNGASKPVKILQTNSGLVLKPILDENMQQLFLANYGLNGFDIFRVDLAQALPPNAGLKPMSQSLHAELTGIADNKKTSRPEVSVAAESVVPYGVWHTPASSLWPKYWFPTLALVQDGFLVGAATTGADPLEQHFYSVAAAYDSRASFPLFNANYTNWTYPVGIGLGAVQKNSYFQGTQFSNRNTVYQIETLMPWNHWDFHLGLAYQQRYYFSTLYKSPFGFFDVSYSNIRQTPSAIASNRGMAFESYAAFYPSTSLDEQFLDWRPDFKIYHEGIEPSHSIGLGIHAGWTTNQNLASNYYLGGGLSTVGDNDFVVRGYPSDVLLGQKIATANLSYTLPLARPYTGWGVHPMFFREIGLRFLADVGTANYVALYNKKDFIKYQRTNWGDEILSGVGVEVLFNNTILYYVPFNIAAGVHRGLQADNGGDTVIFFGLNADIPDLTHVFRTSGPTHAD